MQTDVVIIGGGVVGCFIARELSRFQLDITLLEKEADVACGTSKANSGIIHAGYNADPETLKGKLNIRANPVFDQLCKELRVPFRRSGSLLIGFNQDDLEVIKKKKEQGKKNGVPDLEIIDQKKLQKMEPAVNSEARFALYAPTAGIISPHELTIALADNAVINGAHVLLNAEVKDIEIEQGRVTAVRSNQGRITCKIVINAAGVYSGQIAAFADETINIEPRKGEYFLYDREFGGMVNRVLFPIPTPESKGILVTPTVHDNLLIGPNATQASKDDISTTKEGLQEIHKGARRLVPTIPSKGVIASFAGLRAAAENEDFIIKASDKTEGLIHAAGIQSPGLTSAPAIAQMIVEIVASLNKDGLEEKPDFQSYLPEKPHLFDLYENNTEDWQSLVEKDGSYGEVVCRCEKVTKGEIIDAIRSPVPAENLDAIKRRTRAGMGRCQGGFCRPRVIKILAEELGVSPLQITKNGAGSEYLKVKTKDLLLKEGV